MTDHTHIAKRRFLTRLCLADLGRGQTEIGVRQVGRGSEIDGA
jgi:hypothetical protein